MNGSEPLHSICVPLWFKPLKPSRMKVIQRVLRERGFLIKTAIFLPAVSGEIADILLRETRGKVTPDQLWRGTSDSATVEEFTDFFIHLCREKLLSILVIKGYLSALYYILILKGMDLADCRELSMS